MADYLVPFGVDPRKFLEGINAMDAGTDKLSANVVDAGKTMQRAFETPTVAADALGKKLDIDAQKALNLRDTANRMGKEIGTALSGNNVGAGLEDRITKLKTALSGAGGKGVKLAFDFDEAKLKHFEDLIASGADEFKILSQVVDIAKQKLATLDVGSEEFKQLSEDVKASEIILNEFGEASDEVTTKQKSLKTQLREMKAALADMELNEKADTKEFLQMSIAAGKLEDQIGDVSARVRVLASDTRHIDAGIQAVTGLVGAFTAAQGAVALFGSENEALNEVIQKTTGAMAILQGIQAVAAALNKDSALSVLLFSNSQKAAAVSTAVLTTEVTAETVATGTATVATRTWTAALLANPLTLVLVALAAVVAALIAFSSGSDDAEQAADALNETLERQNKLLGLDEGLLKRRTDLLVADAKRRGATESEVTTIEGKALAERTNLRIENLNETRKLLADRNFVEKLSVEDLKKLQATELKQSEDVENLKTELQVKAIERDKQRADEAKELTKKQIEDAKKAAQAQKEANDQILKFRRDFTQAYIDSILDQYDKDREAAKANINQKIEDLKAEKSLTSKAEKEKNDIITILRQNLTAQLKEIDRKREADRAQLLFEGQQKLAELANAGPEKELQILKLNYQARRKEINEQFKNEGALRVQLLAALAQDEAAATKKIKDEAATQQLKDEEQRQILEIETAAKFLPNIKKVEQEKQIEILKTKIEFAEKSLALLLEQGNAENSTVVLQAKKTVNELKKALGIAVADQKGKGGVDIFDLLGIGDATDEQKAAVEKAAKASLDSIHQITDFIVDQYQRQIDKRQEVIDADNKAISDLEQQLNDEKKLRDEGLANNVDGIRAELDEKKRARDEEIKQQQEMQEKQKGIQRAQLALDSAVQISNLATSSTQIFKTLSPLGPFGIGLAIATIGLMLGAFVTAKVKAFQAISDGQKLEKGGWIEDGKPHSRGGKKFYSKDGDVVELESGEHVTNKRQAEKHAGLLDAINSGTTPTDDALRTMLADLGIHLTDEKNTVEVVRDNTAMKAEISVTPANDISAEIKNMDKNITYLAERESKKPLRWEEGGYIYEWKGTLLSKTPK